MWTKEPWRVFSDDDGMVQVSGEHRVVTGTYHWDETGEICGICRPDAERIVSCVNACAGINPEAVPELLAVCKQALAFFGDGSVPELENLSVPTAGIAMLAKLEASIAKATQEEARKPLDFPRASGYHDQHGTTDKADN